MWQSEKEDLDRWEGLKGDSPQYPITAVQMRMNFVEAPALGGMAADIGQFDLGVPVEESDQLPAGVPGGAENGGCDAHGR